MIARVSPLALSVARSCLRTLPLALLTTPRASFCSAVAAKSLGEVVAEELKSEIANKNDLTDLDKKIASAGWKITLKGVEILLHKEINGYDVRLMTVAKAPAEEAEQEEGAEQNEEGGQQPSGDDFFEMTAFVTKKGNPKCMILNFIVDSQSSSQVQNVFFMNSYEEAMKQRRGDTFENLTYTGPDLNTVYEELLQGIEVFVEQQLTLTPKLLTAIAEYSVVYEQQFYIKWLEDLKGLV